MSGPFSKEVDVLEKLDRIPWHELTHAYGPADDVPDLLRALALPSDPSEEEGPLWQLFGNIWHQGTVYEATSHAVPFLIGLVADPATPDRTGILNLLASIADGTSYVDVHRRFLKGDHEQRRQQELEWVAAAHDAVSDGLSVYLKLLGERGEIRLASAYVLAKLHDRGDIVEPLLLELLESTADPTNRTGYLLLLGVLGRDTPKVAAALEPYFKSAVRTHRLAAAASAALVKMNPMSTPAVDAVLEAVEVDFFESEFKGLPWDVGIEIDFEDLFQSLDEAGRTRIIDRLIELIELIENSGATHNRITHLLEATFPLNSGLPPTRAAEMSPQQLRAIRAIEPTRRLPKRVFHGMYGQWRLPDTNREWADLVAGRESVPVDNTLPILADPKTPRQPIDSSIVAVGRRVVHRCFGFGTVTKIGSGNRPTFTIDFDTEGTRQICP
jgi:hypothetical protein